MQLWGVMYTFCWKIASNSNCDLKIQLGFLVEEGKINFGFLCVKEKLFISVEEKFIPWCERKDLFLGVERKSISY